MSIFTNKLLSLVLSTFFISLCLNAKSNPSLPKREDCIVKVQLQPKDTINEKRKVKFIDNYISKFYYEYEAIYTETSVKPSLAIKKGKRTSYIYFQFAEMCESRFKITNNINNLVELAIPFTAKVYNERILPGRATIRVKGPYWELD